MNKLAVRTLIFGTFFVALICLVIAVISLWHIYEAEIFAGNEQAISKICENRVSEGKFKDVEECSSEILRGITMEQIMAMIGAIVFSLLAIGFLAIGTFSLRSHRRRIRREVEV